MKIDGNAVRSGMVVEHKSRLWFVAKAQHVKPGKGGAYMQVELKDMRDGTKSNERFRADESIERVRLDEEDYQLLFKDTTSYTFMNAATFEQITLTADQVGECAVFLRDSDTVKITSYNSEVIGVLPPETVIMEIVEAEPVVKRQTAASSYKPAVLENGVKIMVPPHIETGTKVIVNTSDSTYVERA